MAQLTVFYSNVVTFEVIMCDWCEQEIQTGCQDCGRMICKDMERGDDIISPPYVTASGDLFCFRCGPDYDRDDEEDGFYDDDWGFWEPVMKKAIARQGPQYSEYQSCMWE